MMRTLIAVASFGWCSIALAQGAVSLHAGNITFSAQANGFRYSFSSRAGSVISEDATAGLLLDGSPVNVTREGSCLATSCTLRGTTSAGGHVRIVVMLEAHHATITAEPERPGAEVRFVTGGASPAYGLADHAVEQQKFSTLPSKFYNTDVTGFADDDFLSGQGQTRLVSNFVIYPRQGFAELLIDPFTKIVHTSQSQIVQGVRHAQQTVTLHYFFGDPHDIYAEYLKARNAAGYKVLMPKYEAFGVGWEAFGALGWDTNTRTVRESIDRYLAEGYPLKWIVIGSGFWPDAPEMHETTSFGFWDKGKYPDPRGLLAHLHDEHLKTMLGLRITFITTGPYSKEGAEKKYFIEKDGRARVFTGGWPKLPYHLLDAHNPAALEWYMGLVGKWDAAGIDGYKEDFYGYGGNSLRDDKVDPTNDRLMADGKLVIERNGYLSSNGDLHRINDFNFNQNQDRGPVNSLALAYSGYPLVYPDIVGGTFGENRFSTQRTERIERYMMRNAQWAALHSSMGMGEPPWTFSGTVAKVMLSAARLHARFAPFLFSNARKFVADGYPWTMTPLPIAFPDDPQAYGHENATDRGYEWLIGDSLLAVPLYGEDYATSSTRNIYLPAGRWMDFDTGRIYAGEQTLSSFALPPEKTPLFVGGSGITLEQIDGAVNLVVYPVAMSGRAVLTLPDSTRPFDVTLRGLSGDKPWRGILVKGRNGKSIAWQTTLHGYKFVPRPGESYRISAY